MRSASLSRLCALTMLVSACTIPSLNLDLSGMTLFPEPGPPDPVPNGAILHCQEILSVQSRLSCDDGYTDCDGNLANGCEVHYLDDPQNCGACGMASDGPCVDGAGGRVRESFGTAGDRGEGLVLDGERVYWMSAGTLRSRSKSGGAITKLAEGELTSEDGIALQNGSILWSRHYANGAGDIVRVPAVGGGVEVLAANVMLGSNVVPFGDTAFYVDEAPPGPALVDLGGARLLETKGGASLGVFGGLLLVDDASGLRSVRADGSEVTTIGSSLGSVVVGADQFSVVTPSYGTDSTQIDTFAFGRGRLASVQVPLAFAGAVTWGDTIFAAARITYSRGCGWIDLGLGPTPFGAKIVAVDPLTGALSTLATSRDPVHHVAVDEDFVYYVTDNAYGGGVYRIARK